MNKKRILQFCHGYKGPFLDVARQYAALFDGTRYSVTTVFLTGDKNEAVEKELAPGDVVFLGYHSDQIRNLKLAAIRDIRRIAGKQNFDLIIAHRFKPIYIACLATRLPVIGVHHAFGDYDRPLRRLFVNLFRRRLLLLAVSNAVRDDIRGRLSTWSPERIETLHNRIDVEAVRSQLLPREEARRILGLPQDAFVFANVGRLHPDKDQATLLKAFAAATPDIPPTSLLVILGQGRLEEKLRQLGIDLGIEQRVRFLGQVPQARRVFKAFDIFVLSSDHEPFGMVLLEAMAAGVPIIASNCGGAPEIARGHGQLFSFGNIDELALLLKSANSKVENFRQNYEKVVLEKLSECFSDQAGKKHFWSLPRIRSLLENRT
jgi:glycosyltransferase involved in cell wall biosynthesis